MLQTCNRCRNRRIKCDSRLPACANCSRSDLECTFRDDALQQDIPRSYIQSLNEKIENLQFQLALNRPESLPQNSSNNGSRSFHILIPARPGSDIHLDNSVPSRFARVVFEALPLAEASPNIDDIFTESDSSLSPNTSYNDRSQITPSILRYLLGRYERCITPQYAVFVPQLLTDDGASFKKLPESSKFKTLMACGIAAARESYRNPSWKHLGQICRDWANELITPIISAGDGDTLSAILLLLIYELAEPSRGVTWELLDLAARTCLQLGWHQAPLVPIAGRAGQDGGQDNMSRGHTCGPDEIRLMSVLRKIEGSLQTIFSRPSMLSGSKLPTTSESETLYNLYARISDQLYGRGGVYEAQGCPFVGEVETLMHLLDTFHTQHPAAKETWISFLPICFAHKQCLFCFQEADEDNAKGMKTLRRKVVSQSSELISTVHACASSPHDFIPPIIASSRAFIAGCSIATGISKKWTPAQSHAKDLIKCTEILALFAPHWKGGDDYLSVWRTIINVLELE
ncbi:Transcriptional activator protein acu-15 [Colletotrichum siamense]|nr:Transcriptional activator protein acu-15 [Colletotrichum siamense]